MAIGCSQVTCWSDLREPSTITVSKAAEQGLPCQVRSRWPSVYNRLRRGDRSCSPPYRRYGVPSRAVEGHPWDRRRYSFHTEYIFHNQCVQWPSLTLLYDHSPPRGCPTACCGEVYLTFTPGGIIISCGGLKYGVGTSSVQINDLSFSCLTRTHFNQFLLSVYG